MKAIKKIKFQSIRAFLLNIFMGSVVLTLTSCVSQNFKNENPVIENQANRDDIATTRISLGLGYLKMGNMSQAKLNLEKAKSYAPKLVQVYTAFAHYYEIVGEHNRTVESYEKALSIKNDDADTLNNYGVYLCRQGKVEASEKQFLKAIAVPSYLLVSQSYANLSSCYLQIDNFAKAETYLNKAISHNPSSASTLLKMVHLQYAMSKYNQAKVYLQRFEKVTRRFSSESLAIAFKVHLKLRDLKVARNYSTLLVKMYPKSWEATQFLLNGLALIDSDNLAKRYKLTQTELSVVVNKPKKKVIKLSPNKSNKNVTKSSTVKDTKRTIVLTAPKPKVVPNIVPKDRINVQNKVEPSEEKEINKPVEIAEISEKPVLIQNEVEVIKQDDNKDKVILTADNKMRDFKPKIHLVLKGESFYSISVKYNIKMSALKRWNKKSARRGLRIADKINLVNPVKVSR